MANMRPKDFAHLYKTFNASISERTDCGQHCAPLNGGTPVCCSTQNAIPIISKTEWKHLKATTDAWERFKPYDANSREIVDELHDTCMAVSCTIAPACQRNARTIACRSFPFFPYMTRQGEMAGIAYYWIFEDRCWVLSNLDIVEAAFVGELMDAYTYLFERDAQERQVFMDQSATARRVFSRWNRPLPVFDREGQLWKVPPKSGGTLKRARLSEFKAHGPYASQEAYEAAVQESQS